MKRFGYIDLFAGCGGLSDGFEQTESYELKAAVEWNKAACETLANRLEKKWHYKDAQRRVLRFDIQRTGDLFNGWRDDPDFCNHPGLNCLAREDDVDIIIGGPPCQAYSHARVGINAKNIQDDYRNYLFEAFIRVVEHYKPKLIIFENVPGMLNRSVGGIDVVERVAKAFEAADYVIASCPQKIALLDLTSYGVPQKRRRVLLVAVRKNAVAIHPREFLGMFYGRLSSVYGGRALRSVRDAIADLPKFRPAKTDVAVGGRRFSHEPVASDISNHAPRYHNRRDISIFRDLAKDIASGANKYVTTRAIKELYEERTGKTSNVHKYYVLRWDEPSNTIPAHLFKDGLRHIHPDPDQARSITVREAARLQTFDDDYEFLGGATEQYQMIGNAVPPMFAKCLATVAYEFLNDSSLWL
jgi:DNA (cytosine-5)-methyltransferase 1